jgi:hypothetical protein
MKALLLVMVFLVLAGCARMSVTELCSSYGFTPGTDAFAGCVQQEHLAARQRTATIISGHAAAQGARDAAAYKGLYGQ